jgi:lysine-specific demethylase 8
VDIVGELPRIGVDALADHVAASRPAVVEGAISDWPALARWTPSYLANLVGDVQIRFKQSANGAHPNFHAATLAEAFATGATTFRELIESLPSDSTGTRLFTGDEKFVLRRRDGVTTIDRELAPLLDDVRVPAAIPQDRLYTIWSWFSGSGVRTWLHYDLNGCHNLNAQIAGDKTCVLIAPEHRADCALFPPGGANPAINCSQVDAFAPDLARFPEFARVPAARARLSPGDLLFIPVDWLHAFAHVGRFNANLNFWWKP